ncbi:hypothetical protein SORBI_3008G109650 [Sorghum bicolor]|uniref:Uncharacterized protein n=1 Tax=Sorghum bicolor TaxID=4558 RepID=A0A1B6PDW2_SORBI|nr:hypothetical protein SORBI_3008G109650 [Sorghum bicolor]
MVLLSTDLTLYQTDRDQTQIHLINLSSAITTLLRYLEVEISHVLATDKDQTQIHRLSELGDHDSPALLSPVENRKRETVFAVVLGMVPTDCIGAKGMVECRAKSPRGHVSISII